MQKQSKSAPAPLPLDRLIHLWDTEQIDTEQMCRELLVWVQRLHEKQLAYEREEENFHHNLADLDERLSVVEEALLRTPKSVMQSHSKSAGKMDG